MVLIPEGGVAAALAPLPVAALRLDEAAVLLARRLGLKRIGQLYDLPRQSLARRFRSAEIAAALVERLDAAFGRSPEPRETLVEPPQLRVVESFPEPLVSSDGLQAAVAKLVDELCDRLAETGHGLRRARLTIYRSDASSAEIVVGLAVAARAREHVLALVAGKLECIDAGFGIDVVTFEALASEQLGETQAALTAPAGAGGPPDSLDVAADSEQAAAIARLVDRLSGRLGAERVQALVPVASHVPERAERRAALIEGLESSRQVRAPPAAFERAQHFAERPLLLLGVPEPIGVVAEVPDGPPVRFTWRRIEHRVARAEGPERIEPEWWRSLPGRVPHAPAGQGEDAAAAALGARVPPPPANRARDYYRVEDTHGGRYWVFRDGLYGRAEDEAAPRWFLHGLFG